MEALALRSIQFPDTLGYLRIQFHPSGRVADVTERIYWDLDFPDRGDEWIPSSLDEAAERLRATFFRAVELRLRADVPVVGYLSGGVDSALVVSAASRIRGKPLPSFTVRIDASGYDESKAARQNAEAIGCPQTVLTCSPAHLERCYPKLILAAENPVIDTSCASLYELAAEVRRQGFRVTLTGEGSDEAMGGYPWFKTNKLMSRLDRVGPIAGVVR
ncbi:MAG TPA: asparagine synthase [Planctomycetaceae bacterium]|nr:asparagine synthase [Planctomycetaceae bacterium]